MNRKMQLALAFSTCVSIPLLPSLLLAQDRGVGGVIGVEQRQTEQARRWAVLIGVNKYEDEQGIGSLKYCVEDMKLLSAVLTGPHGGFQPRNVLLMTDASANIMHRPTYSNMVTMIPRWLEDVGPDDDVVIAFSGHGMTEDGQCYLLPGDAKRGALRLTSVSVPQVREWLEGCRASRKILLLDACHSGAGKAPGQMSEELKQELEQGHGYLRLASCDTKQKSSENPGLEHGVFTYYLAEGLQGKADSDGDGRIDADEAYRYVSREVRGWAREQGLRQDPVRSGRIVGGTLTLCYAPPGLKRADTVAASVEVVELLLQITPGDADVKLDGNRLALVERGRKALARVMPGRHVLEVAKDGHVRMEKVIDVPTTGAEGTVWLAPMTTHAKVYLRSGREMEGELLSRTDEKITIKRGSGKFTLKRSQYDRIEQREVASGESTVEVYAKTSGAVAGAISQGLISLLPDGTLAEQVAEFRKRWEANRESLEKAKELYGEKGPEVRRLERQREALSNQAAELAKRAKGEANKAKEFRDSLIAQGRAKDSPVVQAAVAELHTKRALAGSLALYLPEALRERIVGDSVVVLPPWFQKTFMTPKEDRDQYGNPVIARSGSRTDGLTGLAYEIWLKGPRMEFVLVPAGEFIMGSPESEKGREPSEGPQHRVRLTKPFYLAKYEITQGQWQAVMAASPWSRKRFTRSGSRNAAVYISWNDCQDLLKKLNRAGASGFRLPTEAEWEYACRAGSATAYCFGDDVGMLKDYAWYRDNAWKAGKMYAPPVGQKRPNAWGLYDMHGGVFEQCQDWFPSDYSSGTHTDPRGAPHGRGRIVRGGSFNPEARYSRSAHRNASRPDSVSWQLGARFAWSLP